MGIWQWLLATLRSYPELAIFLALAIGFWIGPKKLAGFNLGNVTATLLAAVVIGQLGIAVPGPIKSTFFLLFLFAVGYGVGPQFFRGLGKEGPKQIVFSVIVLALCLLVPVSSARGSPGSTSATRSGLYAGSQTISASIGVATDQINRLGAAAGAGQGVHRRDPDRLRGDLHLRHDRLRDRARANRAEADRRRPAEGLRRVREADGRRRRSALDAGRVLRLPAHRAPRLSDRRRERPDRQAGPRAVPGIAHLRRAHSPRRADHRGRRRQRARRPATSSSISGPREALVEKVESVVPEVNDHELLDMPATKVDVFVRSKDGERQDAARARGRAVHARRLPAQDHAQHGRDPDPAGDGDPARRHPHASRAARATSTRPWRRSVTRTGRSRAPTSRSSAAAS